MDQNPFLSGNFAPVRHETDADDLRVIGALPRELAGTALRIGPDPQFEPKGRYHWFDGDGMIHAVHLRDGRARYTNRWVRTAGFEKERAAGRALWTGLMEPPDFENPEGLFKNVANTALVFHDGRLLALWEAGPPHHVRLPDLSTVGPYDFAGRLAHPFTAHPKVDPVTGEMVFFGYQFFPPFVQHSVVNAAGELVRTEPIDLEVGVMMHDFAVTERYSVLLDLPMTFRVERIGEQGGFPLAFERDRPSRFGILPRHGTNADVKWFTGPACYVVHTANAYEDGDEVVLTACRMPELDLANMKIGTGDAGGASADGGGPTPGGRMHRWRFDLRTGAMREEPLDDAAADFPRINEAYTGRRNRYAYAARFARPGAGGGFDALIKYDHERGTSAAHAFGPGRFGGEGVFVPRPGGRAEDDGWVAVMVHDEASGRGELVLLDARDFTAPPVARVLIPARVPYGFHAAWVPDSELARQR